MKYVLICLLIFISYLFLLADFVELEYQFSSPEIIQMGDYQTISLPDCQSNGKIGEPMLPYKAIVALLPENQQVQKMEIELHDFMEFSLEKPIYPKQRVQAYSLNYSDDFLINNQIYDNHESYPAESYEQIETHYLNGYSIGLSTFTPVKYFPTENKFRLAQRASVKIFTESHNRNDILPIRTDEVTSNRIKKFVQNPDMISRYRENKNRDESLEVLIITSEEFAGEFDLLQRDYLENGMKSQVKTVEEIAYEINGVDLPEKIRNYIIDLYQTMNLNYVLLAGDVEVVPYRGFYCEVQSSDLIVDNDIPSDLYYSALDGTWNDDNDNLWGEPEESDLLPDVAVSRLPFSSLEKLQIMLNKTYNYQYMPVLNELASPLLVGENLWDNPETWGADYLDLLIGQQDENGYETNGIPETDMITTLYDREIGEWSTGQLLNEINTGHSFIHHSGHSNANYTMRLYSYDISNSNFGNVNGIDHNYTLLYTHGCICGAFDESDCIAEEMLKIDNFLVGFIGNSRYGWFNEGQTEGPSAHLHREFVDALYHDKTGNIAQAHLESKIDTSPWVTAPGQHEEGALRWCFYDCNVLAEPTLSIWTKEPKNIAVQYPEVVNLGDALISITVTENGNPLSSVQCSVLNGEDLIGEAVTTESGIANIEFEDALSEIGELDLFVNGYSILKNQYTISILPGNSEYVSLTNFTVTDGNNQQPEYGENLQLDIELSNLGTQTASNIIASIFSSDQFVSYTLNLITLENLAPSETVTFTSAFGIGLAENIPDMHTAELELTIQTDQENYVYPISFECFAPQFSVESISIIDESENGVLDPGELATIDFTIENIGNADASQIVNLLTCDQPEITINTAELIIENLPASQNAVASFSVEVAETIAMGSQIEFILHSSSNGYYENEEIFVTTIGLQIEDFETGDFSAYDWQMTGDSGWEISQVAYEGMYSAKSSSIAHNQNAILEINFENVMESELSFYRKVSSESSYDFLRFYINEVLQSEWSGEEDWAEESYFLSEGNYTFSWEYSKDVYVSDGDDCAWIDFVILPANTPEVSVDNPEISILQTKLLGNYPNPFNPSTKISYQLQEKTDVSLEIYNVKGQKVVTLLNTMQDKGKHSIAWDGLDDQQKTVSSGIYFYRLNTGKFTKSQKMILMK